MKRKQQGFSLVEIAVALAITGIIAAASVTFIFQIIRVTELNSNHVIANGQVQNAGDWISRDAQRAQGIITDGLTYPDFLVLSWTERDFEHGSSTYNIITYSLIDMSGDIGKLKRNYWNSDGAEQNSIISSYIYYKPSDSDVTSKATYLNPTLTVQLTGSFESQTETRQYIVKRRPTFEY